MQITLNGKAHDIPGPVTVAGLLDALQLSSGQVAVERNRQIVPRSQHGNEPIREGDEVEIVHFIGGG